jgi:hypothetical protein
MRTPYSRPTTYSVVCSHTCAFSWSDPTVRLTIADIGVDFTRMIKLEIPEELTGVTRWLTAMRTRPAAAVAV